MRSGIGIDEAADELIPRIVHEAAKRRIIAQVESILGQVRANGELGEELLEICDGGFAISRLVRNWRSR